MTITDQIKILKRKIMQNEGQYGLDRLKRLKNIENAPKNS